MKWMPFPLVRISAFFIGGILAAIYLPDWLSFQTATVLALSLTIFFLLVALFGRQKTGPWFGALALSSLFLLGYCRLFLANESFLNNHLLKLDSPIDAYVAAVRSAPEEKANSWKIELELLGVKSKEWKEGTGRILLYIAKERLAPSFHYGDKILVQGSPSEIKPPSNPGEFDFKRFLSFRNIFHQQFAMPHQIKYIGRAEGKGFIYYSQQARAWSMEKIRQFISGRQQQVIAAALVLGVTDGIDNDLQSAYAASGAMHVLAVSGLHVGILYMIVLFLLKPLNKFRWSRWLVALLSIVVLWGFAFVTGLSPSVLRAVTMFSFIALARPWGWHTNIYNTLAGSAFLLLFYNPYLVMSVGFQLSYLAVLGIVYLQKPLYNLWTFDNRVGDWIWRITCVSIAAQVATFSLGILYFHQFPVYFLVSNLFVIPLSTGILILGIVLLAVSFLTPLGQLVGLLLKGMIWLLNWIVFQTEGLPFSLIDNIFLTTFQCWLLMAILLCVILLFERKKISWLVVSFALAMVFAFTQWTHFKDDIRKTEFVVYNIDRHPAVEFISEGHSYFFTDSLLANDREKIRFHIQPHRLAHGISAVESPNIFAKDTLGVKYVLWGGKLIAWVRNPSFKLATNSRIDYLMISKQALTSKVNESQISNLIFDASNSKRYIDANFKAKSYNFYSTQEKGAFIFGH